MLMHATPRAPICIFFFFIPPTFSPLLFYTPLLLSLLLFIIIIMFIIILSFFFFFVGLRYCITPYYLPRSLCYTLVGGFSISLTIFFFLLYFLSTFGLVLHLGFYHNKMGLFIAVLYTVFTL